MITRRVTQVTLTHAVDAGDEQWRVEWTEVRKGKVQLSAKGHFTEAAARRHVHGLLEMRAAGLSTEAVYADRSS